MLSIIIINKLGKCIINFFLSVSKIVPRNIEHIENKTAFQKSNFMEYATKRNPKNTSNRNKSVLIFVWQYLHRPFKIKKLNIGIKFDHLMVS